MTRTREPHLKMNGPSGRIVAIGDLNAAADGLRALLRGTGLIDAREQWIGGDTHLVQMGDIFNRGSGARAALELLLGLRKEATAMGGCVTILLGNHEVMTALQDEAYCVVSEYLSFATTKQREAWPRRLSRAARALRRDRTPGEPILPLAPRIHQWQTAHVPGKRAMRTALGPRGRLGRELRRFPLILRLGETAFVHGGLSPDWAQNGPAALNEAGVAAWESDPRHVDDLADDNVLRHPEGPLWDRSLAMGMGQAGRERLLDVLAGLEVERLIVGHTRVEQLPGGETGHVLDRFDSRLVCVDVGISESQPETWAALVMDAEGGHEWREDGSRQLW